MGVYLHIAARNLLRARRRTFLLSLSLVLVTMLFVFLSGLARGFNDTIVRSATALSAGHVNVAGFYKPRRSDAAPIVTGVGAIKAIVNEVTPDLDYVVVRHRGWGRLISEAASVQVGLTGVDIRAEPRLLDLLKLAEERGYKEGGSADRRGNFYDLEKPNTLVLFQSQAKRLEVGIGDAVTLVIETLSGARNTVDLTIVAIAEDVGMMSNWSAFLNTQSILDLYRLQPDTAGAVMVYLKDIERAPTTMGLLREAFKDRGYPILDHDPQAFWMKFEKISAEDWLGQKLDFTTWKDEVSFVDWVTTALDVVTWFLITVLMVIIVVGIMNTMYIAVRDRTREIGTVRAIGMSRGGIFSMFAFEALLLGLVSTCAGGLLGAGLTWFLDSRAIHIQSEAVRAILMTDTLHLVVEPGVIFESIVTFTLVTVVAAIFPAIRAQRMSPVQAIQSAG